MNAQSANPLLTAKIVGSYLRHNTVGASDLPDLISTVHRSLSQLGLPAPVEHVLNPAVSVRQSVRRDYVVCLDCGYRGQTLRRHISSRHGLSRAEYLNRWGLPADHPLTARAYSERRSTLAKQLGLGRKRKAEVAATPAKIGDERVEPDKPETSRTRASGSQSDVADEAAAQPTKTRQRRTGSRVAAARPEPSSPPAADV